MHDLLDLQPLNFMNLSSPIITSSMDSAKPIIYSALWGWSKVDIISAPVATAKRSIPSKSACSITIMPLSANNYSG